MQIHNPKKLSAPPSTLQGGVTGFHESKIAARLRALKKLCSTHVKFGHTEPAYNPQHANYMLKAPFAWELLTH